MKVSGYDSFDDLTLIRVGSDVEIHPEVGTLEEIIVVEGVRASQLDASDFYV